MPIVSTGDGLSLGVSLVLLEIPNDPWIKQSIVTALDQLTREYNWRAIGSNSPDLSARVFSLILQTVLFDYEPPPMIPIGQISEWPAAAAPTGWLLCNGQSLLRASYADLFALIGTDYGTADGTHFNVPDMRDRSPMMPGASTVTALAQAAGAMAVGLTVNQLPAHDHDYADPGHIHALTDPGHVHALTDPGHVHGERVSGSPAFLSTGGAGNVGFGTLTSNSATRVNTDSATTGATVASQVTGASVASHNTGITFHSQGANGLHSNLHPVLGINFIIYAGI